MTTVDAFMQQVEAKNPGETEFLQAVREVAESVMPVVERNPAYKNNSRLHIIMRSIHEECVEHGRQGDFIDYVVGANIAGFVKVADAMLDQGIV